MNSINDTSTSRFVSFVRQLKRCKNPRTAWHKTFHRHEERWAMQQFKDENSAFYLSRHRVTCQRCGINHTVHQSWPKFNADRNQGFLLADAHRRAASFAGQG